MITVYSNGCPKCKVLKMKLEQKGITYTECQDIEKMRAMGIQSLPVLDVDGVLMAFGDAIKYVDNTN